MYNEPAWYVTPQEFADLVVEVMEELNYFKADEFHHPEDIMISFQTVSEALARGMGYAGKRMRNKEAMMKPKNLKKSMTNMDLYKDNND